MLANLLEECTYIPIAQESELLTRLRSIEGLPCFDLFVGKVMQKRISRIH